MSLALIYVSEYSIVQYCRIFWFCVTVLIPVMVNRCYSSTAIGYVELVMEYVLCNPVLLVSRLSIYLNYFSIYRPSLKLQISSWPWMRFITGSRTPSLISDVMQPHGRYVSQVNVRCCVGLLMFVTYSSIALLLHMLQMCTLQAYILLKMIPVLLWWKCVLLNDLVFQMSCQVYIL